ncbi:MULTISPECIES: hypothetical protein [Rhizobium]|uniref:Uncharacterized protein n=1 Tax=Rhizobium tropici TaxID=398 RepID=A0A6P1C3V0_RHITR|nr:MULTISPECIES: hypothetical protein [Rhizobium]AGB73105.1 hypothetical protein RTCIAT899_PA00010 [Rhizobium tropici CIAT 899]MBB4243609.1 hypothetical protein [Rhizobium tropici]MBB5595485.1 hypothetical protein [Rhizobium tropici]MBB6493935.1 hypothetical protein [Rhizobium tropici]NEV11367.1 hypothetical protein [Rhizobium tropici]
MTEPTPNNQIAAFHAKLNKAVAQGRRQREKVEREKSKARANASNYEPAIASFIDVLGFQALLNSRTPAEIHNIILDLREFSTPDELPARRMKDVRLSSRAFAESVSDAVVRVRVFDTQYADGALFNELLDLLHIQIQCINSGVLIRAGVAIGDVHVGLNGKGPIFGPAMVRAYQIESEEARYPRIVIDEAAYRLFLADSRLHNENHDPEEEAGYVNGLLRVGEDGTRYIDYLTAGEGEFDDFANYLQFMERHADLLRRNLGTTHRPNVHRKYVWLARYHNDVLEKMRVEFENGQRSLQSFQAIYSRDALACLDALVVELS